MVGQILWHGIGALPAALIVVALVALAVLWLYPDQLRNVAKPWHWVLPLLRMLALGMIAVSLLKPVLVRPKSAEERGAVVILVDRSRSMSVKDARTPAEQVKLAGALGLLPPGTRTDPISMLDEALDKLAALTEDVARAQTELDYAKLAGQSPESAQARLTDALGKFKSAAAALAGQAKTAPKGDIAAALAELAKIPDPEAGNRPADVRMRDAWTHNALDRVKRAKFAVRAFQSSADSELAKNNPEVRRVCEQLAAESRFGLVERILTRERGGLIGKLNPLTPLYGFAIAQNVSPLPLRGAGEPVKRLVASPEGESSDLTGMVPAALERLRGQGVRAVVLFSDGRQVGGEQSVSSGMLPSGVPMFAVDVAPAATGGAPDLSIVQVRMPASQFVGETATIRCDVRASSIGAGQTVNVNLSVGEIKQSKPITLPESGIAPVEFQVKLDKAGTQEVTISVPPMKGETTAENNERHRWLKVLSDKMKIAVYTGAPNWDYQYLRNALSRTPWIKLQEGILDSDAAKFPLSPAEILEQDLLIFNDLPAAALNEAQWLAVEKLISERGGSAILIAGDSHYPAEYTANLLLKGLVPFNVETMPTWRKTPGDEALYHLIAAPEAAQVDALRLSEDASKRWEQMPALFHYLPAWDRNLPKSDRKAGVMPLLIDRDSKEPVLTESRYGLGRVFFFGANETWRWRYKVGERDQDRFWLQLIRYAAEEPYAVKDGPVALDIDKVAVEPDEPVHLRARVMDEKGAPSQQGTQRVNILREGKLARTLTLTAGKPEGTGRYSGTLSDLPPGEYLIELPRPDGKGALKLPLHVAASHEMEMQDVSGDEQMMRRFAASSGGEMLTLDQVGSLAEKLNEAGGRQAHLAEHALWDSPYLFLFVLACLGAEWGLRKRFGLA
ncbi:MAG TPA: hypothetical protein VIL86_18660 [Tepidisphaeraceae bacterium]|jgi:hypothetical protein